MPMPTLFSRLLARLGWERTITDRDRLRSHLQSFHDEMWADHKTLVADAEAFDGPGDFQADLVDAYRDLCDVASRLVAMNEGALTSLDQSDVDHDQLRLNLAHTSRAAFDLQHQAYRLALSTLSAPNTEVLAGS